MAGGVQRRPTRSYVRGLIGATMICAAAFVVVSWGMLGLALNREPVETAGTPLWFGVVSVGAGLVLLGYLLWRQAVAILRGHSAPLWGLVIGAAVGGYLIWCLFGMMARLTINETWLSPFAAAIAGSTTLASLIFWGVLVRYVYTDRPTPQWPWERREAAEREAEQREADARGQSWPWTDSTGDGPAGGNPNGDPQAGPHDGRE